jgi:hypothetical protein
MKRKRTRRRGKGGANDTFPPPRPPHEYEAASCQFKNEQATNNNIYNYNMYIQQYVASTIVHRFQKKTFYLFLRITTFLFRTFLENIEELHRTKRLKAKQYQQANWNTSSAACRGMDTSGITLQLKLYVRASV